MPEEVPLVLSFADIRADMLAEAGGKAVNLGILSAAGMPVPPGVVVTTEAYRQIATGRLDEVLDALDTAQADDLPALAARARALIGAATVPSEVADAIRAAVEGIGETPVAVRSSATAEDLPFASFAGQQDTYLNVEGEQAVLDAVRRCWASLWTDRAVAYRAANGIDHRAVQLAVVIQEMVDSAVAGVMFTADPVTGRRRQTVIDAAPGLGEAVVSGQVNPDHVVVDPDGAIVERRSGDTAEPCLTDAQILDLAALGTRVEELYGSPQDIEWAIDAEGKLWLTQARPITTLFPLPDNIRDGLRVYLNFNVAQGVFRPLTPMGIAALRLISAGAAEQFGIDVRDRRDGAPALGIAAERMMMDTTAVLRNPVGRAILPRVLDLMEARSAVVLRALLDRPEFSVTPGGARAAVRRIGRVAWRNRIPPRVLHAIARPEQAIHRVHSAQRDLLASLPAPAGATISERLDHVENTLAATIGRVLPSLAPRAITGLIAFGLAARLLRGRALPGELPVVLRALPHNVTTEMDLELWSLATRLRSDDESVRTLLSTTPAELASRDVLPPVLASALAEFNAAYGVRAVAEIDLGMPRWSDDPTHILGVLANYLRLEPNAHAPDEQFARSATEATAMIDTLAGRCGPVRGALVRFALGRTRALAGLRELPKFWFVSTLAAMRSELAVVGADLVAAGRLDQPDDVYFLNLAEVRPGHPGDLRTIVAERRATYDRELRRRHLPRVLLSDGTDAETLVTEPAAEGALLGTPASAGVATGTARVILDPVGAHLEPGEILIAPSTDPGWTPLFLTAGALVMEMGGANSHGAVVAREYGIPAVVGVRDATDLLRTGEAVTVDGTAGSVSPVE